MRLFKESIRNFTVDVETAILTSTSSKGNQAKYVIGDNWLKSDYWGYESLAEAVCSQLLLSSSLPHCVVYEPTLISVLSPNGRTDVQRGCVSKNFKTSNYEIITVGRLLGSKYTFDLYKRIESMDIKQRIAFIIDEVVSITGLPAFRSWFLQLLQFDCIVLNTDRHLHNMILLRDVRTKQYELTPVFDNGGSLLFDTKQDFPLNIVNSANLNSAKPHPLLGASFSKLYDVVMKLSGNNIFELTVDEISIERTIEITELYTEQELSRVEWIVNNQLFTYDNHIAVHAISEELSKI